jgi:hypothetical protein
MFGREPTTIPFSTEAMQATLRMGSDPRAHCGKLSPRNGDR